MSQDYTLRRDGNIITIDGRISLIEIERLVSFFVTIYPEAVVRQQSNNILEVVIDPEEEEE